MIGTNKVPGGFGIYKLAGKNWQNIPGGAVRIAVCPGDQAWVVNDHHNIFRWVGRSWQLIPGAAEDVGCGANGSVWVIGTNPETGGFGIYQFNGHNGWNKIPGSAVRIAVGPGGDPYVVNKQ